MAGLNRYYFKSDIGMYGEPWHLSGPLDWVWMRGQQPDWGRPYIACIGAAHTFGRFAKYPYPEQLAIQGANFGLGGAIPTTFLHQEWLTLINASVLCIVQVPSARGSNTTAWSLERNRAGFVASWVKPPDEAKGQFASEYWDRLIEDDPHRCEQLVAEAQMTYMRDFTLLLSQIVPPKILLWIGKKDPSYDVRWVDGMQGMLRKYPHLVTHAMWESLKPLAEANVVVAMESVKQYYPDDPTHQLVGERLRPLVADLLPQS